MHLRFGRLLTGMFFSELYQLSWVLFSMLGLFDIVFVRIVQDRVLIQGQIFVAHTCVVRVQSCLGGEGSFVFSTVIHLFLQSPTIWIEPVLFKHGDPFLYVT